MNEELGLSPVQETEESIIINQVEVNGVLLDNRNREPNTNPEIANKVYKIEIKKINNFTSRKYIKET